MVVDFEAASELYVTRQVVRSLVGSACDRSAHRFTLSRNQHELMTFPFFLKQGRGTETQVGHTPNTFYMSQRLDHGKSRPTPRFPLSPFESVAAIRIHQILIMSILGWTLDGGVPTERKWVVEL